jgi:hypothetical protein
MRVLRSMKSAKPVPGKSTDGSWSNFYELIAISYSIWTRSRTFRGNMDLNLCPRYMYSRLVRVPSTEISEMLLQSMLKNP